MLTLDPLLRQLAPDVRDLRENRSERRRIDRRSVSCRHSRCHRSAFDGPRQEGGGRSGVTRRANVDVDDLAVLVDRPESVAPVASNADIRLELP